VDRAGVLFGTTAGGGSFGGGVIFRLVPLAAGTARWIETVLRNFGSDNDGAYPNSGVIREANRVLFGTTIGGSTSGGGAVYEIVP
jgi:uncharacterized repeat protein (TIGR03803 family)